MAKPTVHIRKICLRTISTHALCNNAVHRDLDSFDILHNIILFHWNNGLMDFIIPSSKYFGFLNKTCVNQRMNMNPRKT